MGELIPIDEFMETMDVKVLHETETNISVQSKLRAQSATRSRTLRIMQIPALF